VRYRTGQRVRVRSDPSVGHVRTPGYVKGKSGRVERIHGTFGNPESLAYGGEGLPEQPLYMVEFEQRELWPGYEGKPSDTILVDVYEHWLEEAT
jgi:nitrile hydratase